MGAALGAGAIPERFLDRLELRDIIEEIAEDLFNDCRMCEYGNYRNPVWESKYIYVDYAPEKRVRRSHLSETGNG